MLIHDSNVRYDTSLEQLHQNFLNERSEHTF